MIGFVHGCVARTLPSLRSFARYRLAAADSSAITASQRRATSLLGRSQGRRDVSSPCHTAIPEDSVTDRNRALLKFERRVQEDRLLARSAPSPINSNPIATLPPNHIVLPGAGGAAFGAGGASVTRLNPISHRSRLITLASWSLPRGANAV